MRAWNARSGLNGRREKRGSGIKQRHVGTKGRLGALARVMHPPSLSLSHAAPVNQRRAQGDLELEAEIGICFSFSRQIFSSFLFHANLPLTLLSSRCSTLVPCCDSRCRPRMRGLAFPLSSHSTVSPPSSSLFFSLTFPLETQLHDEKTREEGSRNEARAVPGDRDRERERLPLLCARIFSSSSSFFCRGLNWHQEPRQRKRERERCR